MRSMTKIEARPFKFLRIGIIVNYYSDLKLEPKVFSKLLYTYSSCLQYVCIDTAVMRDDKDSETHSMIESQLGILSRRSNNLFCKESHCLLWVE